ncbi:MAG: FAD-dependent thymidylate synthase [Nitrososphaerales archaeon]
MARVILFSYTPDLERVCAAAMRSCYSPHPAYAIYTNTPDTGSILEGEKTFFDDERVRYFIRKAKEMGHMDVLEHGSLTYDLQGVSRTLTHQLVRHRLASFSQQSQRYVKITRSFGYIKPPKIGDAKVEVNIHNIKLNLSFEDIVDITRQAEEGYLALKHSAEDARFIRIGGASTNIVITANPREYLHIFSLRCSKDAQWEIQDACYAMLALAKLLAPTIFETLPESGQDTYIRERLEKIDKILEPIRTKFNEAKRGELIEVPLNELPLHHQVEAYIRKIW